MKLHKSKSSSSERAGSTSIPLQEASLFKKMVTKVSDNYLTEQWERKYYADQYTCCPPPLFIPIISLIQVSIFLLYLYYPEDPSVTDSKHRRSGSHVMVLLGPVPEDSLLIYHPDKRNEIWRFFTYMFAHEGWTHLIFNLTVQLLVGLPLEMVHGSVRLGMIYLTGILAGSLATSIFDPQTILLGASGGVYALLAAHLSNVLLNYNDMELGLLKVFAVLLVASTDVGLAIYDRFSHESSKAPVSFLAHVAGALSGITIGFVVLKNFQQKLTEQLLWWICLGIYLSCFIFGILYNAVYS